MVLPVHADFLHENAYEKQASHHVLFIVQHPPCDLYVLTPYGARHLLFMHALLSK